MTTESWSEIRQSIALHLFLFRAKPAKIAKDVFMTENEISKVVVDTALEVHKALGPGLLFVGVCLRSRARS